MFTRRNSCASILNLALPFFFVVLLFALIYPVGSYGQAASTSGRLEGVVQDSSGAGVPGATVIITNKKTEVSTTLRTDEDGHFVALYLPPGIYEVSIQKEGFQKQVLQDTAVTVGTTTALHPRLTVGKVETSVIVSASAVAIDATQSSLGTVVDNQSIQSLPLNGRNFTDFALLTPGATTDGDFGMISFNGIAGNFNNYTVDGGNNNNAFFAQQIGRTSIPFQFSEDVIQEFQVTSTGYEAEFGQAGGGLVNSVTKSGGNMVHGDAYYYVLDSAFNANDSINNSNGIAKPANRRQQFGGTVGGPIKKDRLFYLANYEGQVRNEPLTVNNAPALLGLSPTFFQDNPGIAAQVNAASGSFPRSFNQNTAFAKLTGNINDKNSFAATYNFQRYRSPHGYFNTPTSTGDGLALTDGATSQFFQFSLQTTFSTSTVNDFRFHFGSDYHFDLPQSPVTSPAVTIQNPDSGFVFGGARFQLATTDKRYQFVDTLTKVLGRHTAKFGVDINVNHDSDYFVYGPKGEYRFANLNDVVTGNFELYLQSFGQSTARFTSPTYSFFAQDQFRATRHLTLNYGLRYDLQVLPQPNPCNPAYEATCHIPYSKNMLSPRVGFAYSLDSKNSTVIRGAFGLFYIQTDLLDVSSASISNGVSRQFLAETGPAFHNFNPVVTYPNSLSSFPTAAGGVQSIVVFAPSYRNPYVEQGNIAVEHQFGASTALSVGYVYSHGLALLGNSNGVTRQANGNFGLDLNLVSPAQQPAFGGSYATATVTLPNGKTYVTPDFSAIDGFVNPNFGPINAVDNSGHSIYNGLLISLRHQEKQFSGSVAYTYSHATDQGTGYFNQFDQQAQKGPSQLDQPQRFVATGIWTPTQRYVKGFEFGAVLNFASGRPYTAVFDNPEVNFSMVPGEKYNGFRGPGVNNVDLNVSRTFRIGERYTLKFVAEAFDIFNHANFQQTNLDNVQYTLTQDPDSGVNNSNWHADSNPHFGSPLAMVPRFGARSFQFSTRFNF
jgi:Carboxypeptidase regulatory-like domain